jgi:hypothetical protein
MTPLTAKITTAVLDHFIYDDCYAITELWDGFGIADVIAIHKNTVIEIEIKTSLNNLYDELKKTKPGFMHDKFVSYTKHDVFSDPAFPFPNKYYFCVPSSILKSTLKFANELNKNYGVLEYNDKISIIRPAKLIHKIDNSYNYKERILEKTSKQLLKTYKELYL